MLSSRDKYIVEIRDEHKRLILGEPARRIEAEHPYLFSKLEFTIDELCYYASYGQGRDNPTGPMTLPAFMQSIGVSYRPKTW